MGKPIFRLFDTHFVKLRALGLGSKNKCENGGLGIPTSIFFNLTNKTHVLLSSALRFLLHIFSSLEPARKIYEGGVEKTKYGPPKGRRGEYSRRSSEHWGAVPTKFLRPVGKRTIAEVVHAAATRLVR